MTSVSRGFLGGLIDKFIGRQLGLPPEKCSFTIRQLKIPLEDDVQIAATLYTPLKQEPFGTLFVRTPYGIGFAASLTQARVFAARGYQVLTSSCRGTFESGGEFEPFRNEARDGHAIVAWMREQSWYTGSFATIGGSYLGYNQWALLSDPPEDMEAAVIWTGLHSMRNFAWGSGALMGHVIGWADIQRRLGGEYCSPWFDAVPLLDAVNNYFGGEAPKWLQDTMTRHGADDDYFEPMNQSTGVEKANIPILLTSGWDDAILPDVIWQYERLSQRGCKVALTVGPWTHLGCQSQNTLPESFNWLEEHLGHRSPTSRPSPVRVFVTGWKEWKDFASWPPTTSNLDLYLDASKHLTRDRPMADTPASTFDFDPAHPTPSVGVPLIFDNGPGRSEGDTALANRSDVLSFDTDVLNEDIEMRGKPLVELQHSTSNPYADLLVVLSDVNAKGTYSRTVSETYLRLPKDRESDTIRLTLTDCAHRFCKGQKIRLMIAGGSHPRYIRNLGTGEDPVKGSSMQVVKHTVRHAVSKVILPVTKTQ